MRDYDAEPYDKPANEYLEPLLSTLHEGGIEICNIACYWNGWLPGDTIVVQASTPNAVLLEYAELCEHVAMLENWRLTGTLSFLKSLRTLEIERWKA